MTRVHIPDTHVHRFASSLCLSPASKASLSPSQSPPHGHPRRCAVDAVAWAVVFGIYWLSASWFPPKHLRVEERRETLKPIPSSSHNHYPHILELSKVWLVSEWFSTDRRRRLRLFSLFYTLDISTRLFGMRVAIPGRHGWRGGAPRGRPFAARGLRSRTSSKKLKSQRLGLKAQSAVDVNKSRNAEELKAPLPRHHNSDETKSRKAQMKAETSREIDSAG